MLQPWMRLEVAVRHTAAAAVTGCQRVCWWHMGIKELISLSPFGGRRLLKGSLAAPLAPILEASLVMLSVRLHCLAGWN